MKEETMVERVARAMARACNDDTFWLGYLAAARAAIEAMRTPTEAMLSQYADPAVGIAHWQGMLDAALTDPPASSPSG